MSRKLAPWQWFVDLLCSDKGQVESSTEYETPATGDDLPAEAFEVKEEAKEDVKEEAASTEEVVEDTAPEELKPQEGLDPKLEKHRAGMHRAFTKAKEKLAAREAELDAGEERSNVVDKFFNDKQYSQQVVQDWARQNGYTVTRAGAVVPATGQTTQAAQLPPQYVESVRGSLPEELTAFSPAA